ncbi:glycosyl hydrolase [Deinococcus cellulosilyticus]|uniref:glycosyl hydrolase n=1 Tax=Deinococcus cellulosilyticus TaxID=401558 RepID=UPI001649EAF5|nr:glycosyl hydrolase [Deinococcus cellulosilyticus]
MPRLALLLPALLGGSALTKPLPAPVELYVQSGQIATPSPLAKYEPPAGCYVGIWADLNSPAGQADLEQVNRAVGSHAVYFRYNFFRKPENSNPWSPFFPAAFVQKLAGDTAAIHLAVEPRIPLKEVTEDLVREWARQARNMNQPIFMRWASEFNDSVNNWSKDPALYREKFRMVARIMHEEAPNVAMVWTPMAFTDIKSVIDYYPGQEFVDWVGITLYSKYYWNGDPAKVTVNMLPTERLETLYHTFSGRHPIQVSEYAAEHHSASSSRDLSAFATSKMQQFYFNIMLKYPRIKNINWLNFDMTAADEYKGYAVTRRANYNLLKSSSVLKTYQHILSEPYFLKTFRAASKYSYVPFPNTTGKDVQVLSYVGDARVSSVRYFLDGVLVQKSTVAPYRIQLRNLKTGRHILRAVANVGRPVEQTFMVR